MKAEDSLIMFKDETSPCNRSVCFGQGSDQAGYWTGKVDACTTLCEHKEYLNTILDMPCSSYFVTWTTPSVSTSLLGDLVMRCFEVNELRAAIKHEKHKLRTFGSGCQFQKYFCMFRWSAFHQNPDQNSGNKECYC